MAIIVPNTASTLAAAASVVGSQNKWAWIGLATPIGASGCVMWFRSGSNVAGRELMPMVACPGRVIGPIGPFNSPSGLFAASVGGGCAVVWMKQ